MRPFSITLPPVATVELLPPGSQALTGQYTAEIQADNALLDAAKSELDGFSDKDMIRARRESHPYQFARDIKSTYGASNVSNAWLKMFEIAHMFRLHELVSPDGNLYAFCNAELPGSFIEAMHHYCDNKGVAFQWAACSLMPKEGETMLPDKYGLYERYKSRWIMDQQMTGDVTSVADQTAIPALVERVLRRKPMLYTSDIGGELQGQYNSQEQICLKLQFGQAVSAVTTLEIGGTAVLKHFTFATPLMQSLHIFLASVFERLHLVKPLTSRASNSENYLVGIGFRGVSPKTQTTLISWLNHLDAQSAIVDISQHSEPFMAELRRASSMLFATRQITALHSMVRILKHQPDKRPKTSTYSSWLNDNPIMPLSKKL